MAVTRVLEIAGDLVKPEVAENLLQLIAEGGGEDEDEDAELRRDAVEMFIDLFENPLLPDVLVRIIGWVVGEYGYLSETLELSELMGELAALAGRDHVSELSRAVLVTALMKLSAQSGGCPQPILQLAAKFARSKNLDLQQRCVEFANLLKQPALLVDVLPVDASCEDIEVDPGMPFLAAYISGV